MTVYQLSYTISYSGKLETPEEKDQPGYNEVKQAEEILGIRQKTKKESMDAVPQKPNYKEVILT